MKKIILSSIICLCIVTAGMAQRNTGSLMRTSITDEPLVIVDSTVTDFANLSYLNPNMIEAVTVLKNADAVSLYGSKGKNGAIVIRMKPAVNLLKLTDVLNQYNIPEQDRNLKVCIDNVLVQDPGKLLLDKTTILRAEVITDTYWKNGMEPGPEERYINIVMVKPTNKIMP